MDVNNTKQGKQNVNNSRPENQNVFTVLMLKSSYQGSCQINSICQYEVYVKGQCNDKIVMLLLHRFIGTFSHVLWKLYHNVEQKRALISSNANYLNKR